MTSKNVFKGGKLEYSFEANGKHYKTDHATILLMKAYKDSNPEMLAATFELGLHFGRIVEIKC